MWQTTGQFETKCILASQPTSCGVPRRQPILRGPLGLCAVAARVSKQAVEAVNEEIEIKVKVWRQNGLGLHNTCILR